MAREILTRRPPPADARIPYGPDPSQFGELRVPAGRGPHPVCVYVHGGCWMSEYDLAHAGHVCAALTAAGFATWSLEYRRIGRTGGGWPATMLDVAHGTDHIRRIAHEHGLDLARIVTAGHSAGGHLALWLAARHRLPAGDPLRSRDPVEVRGAVGIAGLLDLARSAELGLCGGATERLLGGSPSDVPDRYASASPYALLPLGVPQALVHGRDDAVVPLDMSERYAARAVGLGDVVELVTLDGVGHFEPIDPGERAFRAVRDAVERLLP